MFINWKNWLQIERFAHMHCQINQTGTTDVHPMAEFPVLNINMYQKFRPKSCAQNTQRFTTYITLLDSDNAVRINLAF